MSASAMSPPFSSASSPFKGEAGWGMRLSCFPTDSRHVRRILAASLLSIAMHLVAWQWFLGHAGHRPAPSLPDMLEVTMLRAPLPAPPAAPPARPAPAHIHAQPTAYPAAAPLTAAPTATATPLPAAAPPAAPPAQVAAEHAPEPLVTPPLYRAAYLHNPPPAYPLAAKRRGLEGSTLLRAEVQTDGSCSRTELKQSSGWDMLDQAALQAVRGWRFEPARRGDQAMVAWVEIPITFRLEN